MAETEPAFSTRIGTSQQVSSTEPSHTSRHSRIHFPVDEPGSSRSDHSAAEYSQKSPPLGSKSSPVRQGSPLRPSNIKDATNGRRRVRSVHAAHIFAESPRPNRVPAVSLITPVQRITTITPKHSKDPVSEVEDLFGHGVFSDEYDLCELCLLFDIYILFTLH
jgi:hypothetical protein